MSHGQHRPGYFSEYYQKNKQRQMRNQQTYRDRHNAAHNPHRMNARWTEEELNELQNWSGSARAFAEAHGRTIRSVEAMKNRLGIKKRGRDGYSR